MFNKKSVMAFAGLQILVFHLWVSLFPASQIALYFKQTAYVGVDTFFFVSAFSLCQRKVESYQKFMLSRFKTVYIKFVLFALAACIFGSLKWARLWKAALFVDLFTKGGGAFLWFLPAIMLFYAVFPPIQKLMQKNRTLAAILTFAVWAAGALVFTLLSVKQVMIFWNRIPVFLLGLFLGSSVWFKGLLDNTKLRVISGCVLLLIGNVLMWFGGYMPKLQVPFIDMFYVLGIPISLGSVFLIGMIKEVGAIKWVGSSTLELYGVQMVFGYSFTGWLLKNVKNVLLTNICTLICLTAFAVLLHFLTKKLAFFCSKSRKIV